MNEINLYKTGMSIHEINEKTGTPLSTIRFRLKKAGVLRSRSVALKVASKRGRLGLGNKGKKRVFTQRWKDNISKSKKGKGNGISLKKNGYIEITMGENKFRGEHVVIAEKLIGRKLFSNECVHHVDGNRSNNVSSNLIVMTRSNHAKLHAHQRVRNGTNYDISKQSKFGEAHVSSKLTEKQVVLIIKSNLSANELSEIYSVSKSCIKHIKSRRSWKHIIIPEGK